MSFAIPKILAKEELKKRIMEAANSWSSLCKSNQEIFFTSMLVLHDLDFYFFIFF